MMNILTSSGLNTMSFSTNCICREYLHILYLRILYTKGCLLINKMQSQILNPLSALLFVPWQVVYKYCDKSFINEPAF